ncbi:MAG: protein kinase [Betaproteobacteria bacterium]|nr:protein kinase [Betaproteobacteria bacterium]MDH3413290.1 protein kinase [Gammaproteobacteria bacterium]
MLGHYQIGIKLGKGATGVVYQTTDCRVGRVVAIKTLALSREYEFDDLEQVRARFFREAETAGRLAHPNIVTVHGAGEARDLAYIAMAILKGKDPEQRYQDGAQMAEAPGACLGNVSSSAHQNPLRSAAATN